MRLRALSLWLPLVFVTSTSSASRDDPWAGEYAPPASEEVGTSAGQLRLMAEGGGFIGHGIGLAGQGSLEFMTIPWIGIRGSSMLTLPFGNDPQLWAFRLGPSLHILPHRRVDLGIFGEGGFCLVDITKDARTVMPVIAGGGTIDIALSSFVFVRLEGLLQIGIADRGGRAETYVNPIGLAGLGLAL